MGSSPFAPIEDYALIADTHSAALVSRTGSIDWLCMPRFDSASVFGAILDPSAGSWVVRPVDEPTRVTRRYRDETMVLETTFETDSGSVRLTDCLIVEPHSDPRAGRGISTQELLIRRVEGLSGSVEMEMSFAPRFDYGDVSPWLRSRDDLIEAVGGPDAVDIRASTPLETDEHDVRARFQVERGAEESFVAAYHLAHLPHRPVEPEDAEQMIDDTAAFWAEWARQCRYQGRWRNAVLRSLLTLKSMIFSPSGAVLAAPTTSLPEEIGGTRNWDYRYGWLRDATFTLEAFIDCGYQGEAEEWSRWLLRAVAGDPEDMQIMYGVLGERRLYEHDLGWLSGYRGSKPVRLGNAAHEQFQLDVYGEVMDSFHSARRAGIDVPDEAWELQKRIAGFVTERWREPDEGIWEVRSGRRQFVHSKVMAWVALDRAVKAVESFGRRGGDVERWRDVRDEIRDEVMNKGVDRRRSRFKRSYDEDDLDAALLMLPLVGFVDAGHEIMANTIDAVRKELSVDDALILRYRTDSVDDGLPPGEGAFLLTSFWMVDCLALAGDLDAAELRFERLLELQNDVGLLAEEYDPTEKQFLGNFPQAFSHVALVTAAKTIETARTARQRVRGA